MEDLHNIIDMFYLTDTYQNLKAENREYACPSNAHKKLKTDPIIGQ